MKHEKAIVITLAYIIGFITAYIAFAINDADKKIYEGDNVVIENSEDATTNTPSYGIEAMVNDAGLYMIKDGKKRILSARVAQAAGRDGYHDSIAVTQTSPDGRYIFYCAVLTAGAENCSSYMYLVEDDVVRKVEPSNIPVAEAKIATWSSDGLLQIGEMASKDMISPWMMR